MSKKKNCLNLVITCSEKICVKNWKLELQERHGRFISIPTLIAHSLPQFSLSSGVVYRRAEASIIIAFKIGKIIKVDISSLDPYRTIPFDENTKFRKLRLLKRAIVKDLEPYALSDAPEYIPLKSVAAFFKINTKFLKIHIMKNINRSKGENPFGFIPSKKVNKFMKEITNSNTHSLYHYKAKPHLMRIKSIPLLIDDMEGPNSDNLVELYHLESMDNVTESKEMKREEAALQVAECMEEISKSYL